MAVKELLDREKPSVLRPTRRPSSSWPGRRPDGRRIAAVIDRNHNRFHAEEAGFSASSIALTTQGVARALLERAGPGLSITERSLCAVGKPLDELRVRCSD